MRLHLFFAIIGIILVLFGFLAMAAGILGWVIWVFAAISFLLAIFTYFRRKRIRDLPPPSAPPDPSDVSGDTPDQSDV